jgi:hypothetical protein
MKMEKLAVGLTAINFTLLLMAAVHAKSAAAPDAVPVIRTQSFELVDEKGQVRSRLNVEEDGTVMLRMFDEKGAIRVKLGADKAGSGLVLLDEATEPGVHIVARGKGETGIKLQGADKKQRVIEP